MSLVVRDHSRIFWLLWVYGVLSFTLWSHGNGIMYTSGASQQLKVLPCGGIARCIACTKSIWGPDPPGTYICRAIDRWLIRVGGKLCDFQYLQSFSRWKSKFTDSNTTSFPTLLLPTGDLKTDPSTGFWCLINPNLLWRRAVSSIQHIFWAYPQTWDHF